MMGQCRAAQTDAIAADDRNDERSNMNPGLNFPMTAQRLSSLAAMLAIITGLVVLAGWQFNITLLKSISPNWVSMKVNAAICFVFTGIALWLAAALSADLQRSIAFSFIAQLCSMIVGLVGILTMSEYAFDWNLGIDQLLFQEPVGTAGTTHPGRMAPDAALCFSMLAVSLWLSCGSFRKRWNICVSVSLGMLVLTIALMSMLSYLLPGHSNFGWFGYTLMAVHTAILFTLLGMAAIATSWRANILSWSLKSGLTLFTLFILLFSLWSLTFFSSRMLYRDLQQQLSEQQLSSVSHMAADIDAELNNRLLALEDVAGTISPTILNNREAIQSYLEGLAVVQRLFNAGIFATQMDGTATASVPLSAKRVSVNYMERDHVEGALREGKSTVGKPVIIGMLHSPVISMSVPIRNKQGTVIGSLTGVTDLNAPNFLDSITEGRYGKTGGYLLVASRYRLIVTASDKNLIMQPLPAKGINPVIDRHVSGYEGADIFFNPAGIQVLDAVKGIHAANWYVVVSLPTREAFASIHDMQRRMLLAAFILTVLMVSLTWWMLKRQMSPVFSAMETLAELSNSDQIPRPLPIVKMDEIGRLISSFNNLLKTIAQREGALRESENCLRKLSLAVEQSSESIIITDINANIEYVNKAFILNTGYSVEEVIGQNARILNSGKTPPETYEAMWKTLRQGLSWKGMFYTRKKDGSEYIEFAIITPLRQPDGSISNYVAVKEDITERKKLGEELDRHRRHLEELVLLRTHELLAARQQADAVNEARRRSFAVLSRKVRAQLATIFDMNHLMHGAGLTSEQAAHLDRTESAAQHLLAIINSIPDMDKIESDGVKQGNADFTPPQTSSVEV